MSGVEISDAVTSLGFLKTLKIVASREKPRSTMATVIGVGVGVAAAAFLVSSSASLGSEINTQKDAQGRAGLVALRKYRGGATAAGVLGKAFYKGGFEPKMNRREASLILQLK